MTRSLAIVLLLAIVCAAGAWLVSHRSTEPLSPPLRPEPPVLPQAEASTAIESEQVAAQHLPAAPSPRVVSSRPEPITGPKATLEVLCVSAKDGRPADGVRLDVIGYPEAAEAAANRGAPGRATSERLQVTDHYAPPRTDENGRASIEVPAGIPLYVGADGSRLAMNADGAHCAALEEGQRKLVRLELHLSNDTRFRGLVVDAASGDAQSDVVVSSNERSQSLRLATTGNDGRFEVPATTGGASELRLEKDGYVPQVVRIAVGDAEPAEEQVFRLVRGAVLQGFLLDADSAPVHQSSVRVWRESGFESRGFCDARGWFAIDGLPPGVELQVEVEQWRRRVRSADALPPLDPGETRRLDLRMPRRVRLAGIAVDEDHAPIAGIELALLRVPATGLACVDASLVPEETVKTDSEGKFAFTSASDGSWAIAPALQKLPYPGRELPAVPLVLSLPEAAQHPIELQLFQHTNIRGRVLAADGKPAPRTIVLFRLEGCPRTGCVQASEDGSFSANVSGPWTYRVRASTGRVARESEELSARAGDAELVLKLGEGARLEVHVNAPGAGDIREASLLGVGDSTSTGGSSFTAAIGPDGRAGLELPPGSYRFLARIGAVSWSDVRTATIEAGKPGAVEELELRPTAWITLAASGFESNVEVELRCEGILVGRGILDPLLPRDYPAPPAALVIAYRAEKGSGDWKLARASPRAGEKQKLSLEP